MGILNRWFNSSHAPSTSQEQDSDVAEPTDGDPVIGDERCIIGTIHGGCHPPFWTTHAWTRVERLRPAYVGDGRN